MLKLARWMLLPASLAAVTGVAIADSYTFTIIADPSFGDETFVSGINDQGQFVGTFSPPAGSGMSQQLPLLYSGGTYSTITTPYNNNFLYVDAYGINNVGQIVGEYGNSNGNENLFLDSGGIFTTLDPGVNTECIALCFGLGVGINDSGQVVVSYSNGESFLYSNGVYTPISDPLATYTLAYGINNAGQIVGRICCGPDAGFVYSDGTFTTLFDPLGVDTEAAGINNSGQIVGSYIGTNDVYHGFLYSGGTYTTIDFPGPNSLDQLYGINDQGEIVGYYGGLRAQGPFLAMPAGLASPEPSTLVLALSTLLGIAAIRRWKFGRGAEKKPAGQ